MKLRLIIASKVIITGMVLMGCGEETAVVKKKIYVKNTMDIDRSYETVSLAIDSLHFERFRVKSETDGVPENIVILNDSTQEPIISQTIDTDGDGIDDTILFQPEVSANSEIVLSVSRSNSTGKASRDSISRCYSRFVPERTDDYAWENDRVAFRTYGPIAQKMVEDGEQGGTLSSGIDAWLKRVDYPIINKWYKKELETDGSYHVDTGEGLDNFHVGPSRGVGGIAVKSEDIYHTSKNFNSWKRLYNGPIRTSFVLNYADWVAAGKTISEEKHISLDYGSNLSRFEIDIEGTDTISAGLTLHDNKGRTSVGQGEDWISYWEPHEESELGTGLIVPGGNMIDHEKYESDEKDKSNLFAKLKLNDDGKVIYYVGFGWKKSGQFESQAQWEAYLNQFSKQLENPLVVEIR